MHSTSLTIDECTTSSLKLRSLHATCLGLIPDCDMYSSALSYPTDANSE